MNRIKKLILACIAIVSLTAAGVAVTGNVSWGPAASGDKGGQALYWMGDNSNDLYYLRVNKKLLKSASYHIDIFSKDKLSRSKSLLVDFPDSTKTWDITNYSILGDNVYFFFRNFNKQTKQNSLYLYRVNNNGKVDGGTLLESIQEEKRKPRSAFMVRGASDEKHLLLYSRENADQKNMHLQLYDNQLVKKWESDITLPFEGKKVAIGDIQVDPKGDVFMLVASVIEKGSRKEKRISKKWSLIHYSNAVADFTEYDLQLKNKYISDLGFAFNKKGDLVVSGFYSKDASSGYTGVFNMILDATSRDVISTVVKDFDPAFVAEFIGEKKAEKGKDLNNYYLREILVREDGGSYMVSEYYRMVEICRTDPKTGSTTCTYHYYYNDLIVANFGANGTVEWTMRVPKTQHTVNDGGRISSIYTQMVNDELKIVYNDNPKNLNPKKPGKQYQMKNHKKSILVINHIDKSGKSTVKEVFNNKLEKMWIAPTDIDYFSEDKILVYDVDRKEYRIGTMSL